MLDSVAIDNNLTNENSYDSLVAVIEASQGMLALLIASCEPGSFQNQLIERYETELAPEISSYRVTLDRSEPSLRAALEQLVEANPQLKQPQASAVITVTGAAELLTVKLRETEEKSELERFFGYLQWTREGLRAFPYPIVLWVTPKILPHLSIAAPDFWSWRSGVFRFVAPVRETKISINTRIEEISPLLMSETLSDLPLDELKERIAQIQQQNDLSPALATLYDRVGQAYTSRITSGKSENLELEIGYAIDYFQQAITLQTTLNLKPDRGKTLIRLGNLYHDLGQYQSAIESDRQSLAIFREIGDRQGEASSYGSLGNAYNSLGQYQEAISYHQQSLAIFREIGDRKGEANSYNNLGNAYNSLGQYPEAISYHQQSLAIAREIGDRKGEANSYNNLGSAYNSLGRYPEAISYHQQSLAIVREIGDRNGEAHSYGNLGNAYNSLGRYPEAISYHQQSLAIFREIGDRRGEAGTWFNLGLTLSKLKQKSEAKEAYLNARALYQAMGLDRYVRDCNLQVQQLQKGKLSAIVAFILGSI